MSTLTISPTDFSSSLFPTLQQTAQNLAQRLLQLSADPDSSLDQIGKLQRALTGILRTLAVIPENPGAAKMAGPASPEPAPEPQEAPPAAQPPSESPSEPASHSTPDPPALGQDGIPRGPAPPGKSRENHPKIPQAKPKAAPPPRKAPKYLRRMMKRHRRKR